MDKTNVMRILDRAKVKYNSYEYPCPDGAVSGTEVAGYLGKDESQVFKTLVTVGKSNSHYVFVIPVNCELDLKKAAASVGEKNTEMVKSKELLPLTGYVHGGCSPIGMKKFFTTVIDESAKEHDFIVFSAGKIGCQVEVAPRDLEKVIRISYAPLTRDPQ